MDYGWYYLTWNGLVNPLMLFIVIGIIGALWGVRILSNRAFLGLVYAVALGWVIHLDHLMFVIGWGSLPPLEGWAPLSARLIIYAIAWAFMLWGTWGWIRFKTGTDKMEQSRGLPYLRERLQQRRRG